MGAFRVRAKEYVFPTTETMSRYEQFRDGRIADKKRTVAEIEFTDGKVAFYDFDSEQYRSPIRSNYVNVRGCRGELKDNLLSYLDGENLPQKKEIEIEKRDGALSSLSEDETAVARVMEDMAAYAAGRKEPDYPLCEALQDAYMAVLLRQSIEEKRTVESEKMPWWEASLCQKKS